MNEMIPPGSVRFDPQEVQVGYADCESETRRVAANFALGIRLLPRDRRRALSAVYWFSHLADDAVDSDGTVEERRGRLEHVRAGLEASLNGHPPDPRWTALAHATGRYEIPPALYHRLLAGVADDLEPARYPDWEALREYCYGVAGVVGLIGLRIFGGGGSEAERRARELGYALQLTNILRDLREDAEQGRWYLPMDECRRFGVTSEAVSSGRAEPGYNALVAFQVERARRYYDSGAGLYHRLPRSTRACPAALAGVYRGLLDRIATDPRAPLRGRIRLPARSKVSRGLLAAVRAIAG